MTKKARKMKGVILAGGLGTRLHPLTLVTNKHLLPVYDKPVIYYSIEKLLDAGVERIMIVTAPHQLEGFIKLLGSGQDFISKKTGHQIQIVYGIQNNPNGVAYGLYVARDYVGEDDCILYLGDNLFEDDISEHIKNFDHGALIFLKAVDDPERFGVAEIGKGGKIISIEEKPKKPKSNMAVTGLYVYDNSVFQKIVDIGPSKRGEHEISDLNNKYLKEGTLKAALLDEEWFDIGTIESLLEASNFMKNKNEKNKLNIKI